MSAPTYRRLLVATVILGLVVGLWLLRGVPEPPLRRPGEDDDAAPLEPATVSPGAAAT